MVVHCCCCYCCAFSAAVVVVVVIVTVVLSAAVVVKKFLSILLLLFLECVPGKYLWREEKPDEFFACVEPMTRRDELLGGGGGGGVAGVAGMAGGGAEGGRSVDGRVHAGESGAAGGRETVKLDRTTNSIRMKCNPGTFMCVSDLHTGTNQVRLCASMS